MFTVILYDKYYPDIYVYDGENLIYERTDIQSYVLRSILSETVGKKAYIKEEHFKFFIELMESVKRGGWSGKNTKELKINSLRKGFSDIIRK